MEIALLTSRGSALAPFIRAFEARHFRVVLFGEAWRLQEAVAARPWTLVLLDGSADLVRALAELLLAQDAGLSLAALGENCDNNMNGAPDPFEGLGLVAVLPELPGAEAVAPLLAHLRALEVLDPQVEAAQARLVDMGRRHHGQCVVCWDRHPFGLKVDYRVTGPHTVEGTFGCGSSYQGYSQVVHGGIVSSLLDGAMASCVLAKGLEAYTVDLRVRFRSAVETGTPALIRGEWLRGEGPLHLLQASLLQDGKVRASARAKFFEGTPSRPSGPLPGGEGTRHLVRQARKRLV